jgi:hypothetical protein
MAKYEGVGHGPGIPFHVALDRAVDNAWEDAKSKGKKPGDELKVDEISVKAENPVNWARVVLSD